MWKAIKKKTCIRGGSCMHGSIPLIAKASTSSHKKFSFDLYVLESVITLNFACSHAFFCSASKLYFDLISFSSCHKSCMLPKASWIHTEFLGQRAKEGFVLGIGRRHVFALNCITYQDNRVCYLHSIHSCKKIDHNNWEVYCLPEYNVYFALTCSIYLCLKIETYSIL